MSHKKSKPSRSRRQKNNVRRTSGLNTGYEPLELRQLLANLIGPSPDIYVPANISNVFSPDAVTLREMLARTAVNTYAPGELVVAVELPVARNQATNFLRTYAWNNLTGINTVSVINTMMTVARDNHHSVALVRLDLGPGADVVAAMTRLDHQADVYWSSPNFVYSGADPRDFTPNDPSYASQYHHPLMSNNLAWDISLGNPNIRIGVTDDGVLLTHPDLAPNIFVNAGEISGNGLDDDSNGYIDDVTGWDFSSNNNDPNPNAVANDHGTHVSGIAAGRTNNAIGIAGTAGLSTIMPLQFYAGTGAWTAAVINATYRYAADMGAQIVTTSYNVDSWVGDPVFTAGLQYMYDAGVLHFNSAGNNNALNPPRQVFEQSLFVASTDSADLRSSFSNYGTGIDISAPGSNIFSTIAGNSYGTKSGTSMSTPNAAGAAALLWGANPTWNRDQVAARLLATATNIDALNPSTAGLLGTGRVNTFAALTTALAAPKIKSLTGLPAQSSVTNNFSVGSFTVSFNQVLDPASVNNSANFVLRESGADGIFGNGDDRIVPLTVNKTYRVGTNELTFTIGGAPLEPGNYQLSLVSGGLKNPFNTALDGNGDGTGGDNFIRSFTLAPNTVQLLSQGSQVYEQRYSANISTNGEKDDYYLNLDAGQKLSISAQASGALVPTIQVRNPAGVSIANVNGSAGVAFTSNLEISTAGRYRLTFGGVGASSGLYNVRIVLNAGLEIEGLNSSTNNTLATAQGIDATAIGLGTGMADRLAVVGQLPSSAGTALYSENFESGSLGSQWTTASSTANGRIRILGSSGTAAGSFAMLMDTSASNVNNRNQADWTVNLAGLTAATLRFSHTSLGDEVHTLPASFTGSSDGDGVAISANGTNWFTVFSPTTTSTSGLWIQQNVDLVAAANAAGISLNSNFRIRFQQFDNNPIPTDGRGYDEISILTPAAGEDWFSFSLADGESAALAASRLATVGSVNIALYNGSGTLLRSGVSATNISSYISRFQDTTTNGVRDNYFVRITGSEAEFNLLVTRNAEFDREANDATNSTAQDINGLRGAFGFATTNPDFYSFTATAGEAIRFDASLPAGGPDLFVNGLGGSSNLQLQLIAPGGATVATGTSNVQFTAASSGTYYLRVAALSGNGEYFAERAIPSSVKVETGTVNMVGLDLISVTFSQTFVDPIVIISPPGFANNLPILASVTNVGPNGFDVRLSLWNTAFETPVFENLKYIVLERGVTTLPNGSRIIAGEALASDATFVQQTFSQAFATVPVVVTSAELSFVQYSRTSRVRSITTNGFELATQFAERSGSQADEETPVYYLAMEPGRYSFGTWEMEVGLTPTLVSHLPNAFNFQQPFAGAPTLLANIQTFNESDPAALRLINLSATGATLFIGEEQTLDLEMNHAPEQVGYVALYQTGLSRLSNSNPRGKVLDESSNLRMFAGLNFVNSPSLNRSTSSRVNGLQPTQEIIANREVAIRTSPTNRNDVSKTGSGEPVVLKPIASSNKQQRNDVAFDVAFAGLDWEMHEPVQPVGTNRARYQGRSRS